MDHEKGTEQRSPSMLDLVRLSPRRLFPPGGADLYRQVARLMELAPGMELLDVASGLGVPLEFFVREFGVHGTGIEEDPHLLAAAEAHVRGEGLTGRLSFQKASPGDLPFRDETFDVVVGEVGLAARVDPKEAIRELARVTRPAGKVALIQLVWKAPVDLERRRILSDHLGARPLMSVEVRRVLMDSGVTDLVTEDWTDEDTAFRQQVKMPFPDFSELFSLREKLGILRRAWGRWGWRGVLTVFQREVEVHRLLTKERLLGLTLVAGRKSGRAPEADETSPGAPPESGVQEGEPGAPPARSKEDGDLQASGLPLFGSDSTG